jgi:hypothetical protein
MEERQPMELEAAGSIPASSACPKRTWKDAAGLEWKGPKTRHFGEAGAPRPPKANAFDGKRKTLKKYTSGWMRNIE